MNGREHRSIAVLAALPVELDAIARRLGLRPEDGWRRGRPGGLDVRATATGVGLARAAQSASAVLATGTPPDALVIAGIAGGLRPGLAVGEVVLPAEVVSEHDGRSFFPTLVASGDRRPIAARLVSVAAAATRPELKAELRRRFDADLVDMESAAIAAACAARGVPWLCIRAISDDADGEIPAEVLSLTDADGHPRPRAALGYALRHPSRLPQLVRLGRDTRTAVAALAEAVADVLCAMAAVPAQGGSARS